MHRMSKLLEKPRVRMGLLVVAGHAALYILAQIAALLGLWCVTYAGHECQGGGLEVQQELFAIVGAFWGPGAFWIFTRREKAPSPLILGMLSLVLIYVVPLMFVAVVVLLAGAQLHEPAFNVLIYVVSPLVGGFAAGYLAGERVDTPPRWRVVRVAMLAVPTLAFSVYLIDDIDARYEESWILSEARYSVRVAHYAGVRTGDVATPRIHTNRLLNPKWLENIVVPEIPDGAEEVFGELRQVVGAPEHQHVLDFVVQGGPAEQLYDRAATLAGLGTYSHRYIFGAKGDGFCQIRQAFRVSGSLDDDPQLEKAIHFTFCQVSDTLYGFDLVTGKRAGTWQVPGLPTYPVSDYSGPDEAFINTFKRAVARGEHHGLAELIDAAEDGVSDDVLGAARAFVSPDLALPESTVPPGEPRLRVELPEGGEHVARWPRRLLPETLAPLLVDTQRKPWDSLWRALRSEWMSPEIPFPAQMHALFGQVIEMAVPAEQIDEIGIYTRNLSPDDYASLLEEGLRFSRYLVGSMGRGYCVYRLHLRLDDVDGAQTLQTSRVLLYCHVNDRLHAFDEETGEPGRVWDATGLPTHPTYAYHVSSVEGGPRVEANRLLDQLKLQLLNPNWQPTPEEFALLSNTPGGRVLGPQVMKAVRRMVEE